MFENGGVEAEQASEEESRLSHKISQCHLANERAQ